MNPHHRSVPPAPPARRPAAFVCPVCLTSSQDPDDGREDYCGVCHGFTTDPTYGLYLELLAEQNQRRGDGRKVDN